MRYRYRVAIDCEHLGRRVSVRYDDTGGVRRDVVGILETCDEQSFGVRDRRGELRLVRRADVVAAKVVPGRGRPPADPGVL